MRIAVVGAHLSGLPLNHALTDLGAKLVKAARTSPVYRLFALPNTAPPKPGMLRVGDGPGGSIDLEIWELDATAFGTFVSGIPSPLGIGTIELDDGGQVQGFLVESYAVAGAQDITRFGGWRNYLRDQAEAFAPASIGREPG